MSTNQSNEGQPPYPKVLALVPKGLDIIELDKAKESVVSAFSAHDVPVRVITSKEWYDTQFQSAGCWNTWVWETINGKDYETRKPHFSGYVVVGDSLARGGANIANLALRNGLAVYALVKEKLEQVVLIKPSGDAWVYDSEPLRGENE